MLEGLDMLCAYLGYLQRCLSVRWWSMEPSLIACSEKKKSSVTVELSEEAAHRVDDERWYNQSDHWHQMDHCHTLASQGGGKHLGRKGFFNYLCSNHLDSKLKSSVHGVRGKESSSHGKDCLRHGLVGKPSTGQDGQTNSQHGKGSRPPERHKGLVSFFPESWMFWPSSQPLQSHNGEQISRELKCSWYLPWRARNDWYLFEYKITNLWDIFGVTYAEGDIDGKVKVCDVSHCAVKLQAGNIL